MASVLVLFGGKEQGEFSLDKDQSVVGRDPSCGIFIDNLGISRQHCAFIRMGSAFLLRDLGSSNGTYVNGKKVSEHFLNHGDEVVIGKYLIRFKNEDQSANVAVKPAGGGGDVPETQNTYVMDGGKIQEQLARMRSQGNFPEAGSTAADYAKAFEGSANPKKPETSSSLKTMVIILIVLVVILILAVALFAMGIIKLG